MAGRSRKVGPCSECPFRRKSAPGWIGNHINVMEIIDIVEGGQKFPCHAATNKMLEIQRKLGKEEDLDRACQSAHHCIGALNYISNRGEGSPAPYIQMQASVVGKNKSVFNNREEMIKHHGEKRRY